MNNAEKVLVEQLTPTMAVRGFKWLKARELFVRKAPYGFCSFSWASYPTSSDGGRIELVPLLGVRHDVVENLVNELGLIYGDANRKYTMTVDRGLGFFPFKEDKDYKQYIRLASVNIDVETIVSSIASMLDEEGKAFFEKYSSLLECSRGLNHPIETETHPLCNNFPLRAYYGVASAFLAEKERVPELVRQYMGFAKAVQPNHYDQIAKRLDHLVSIAQSKV